MAENSSPQNETDWKYREQGWRVGGKRADVIRHLFCLLAGHDWQVNRRETQRVCLRCWWCHDRADAAETRCPTCIHPEGYDRLSGPCPTCRGEGAIESFGPAGGAS